VIRAKMKWKTKVRKVLLDTIAFLSIICP